MDTPHVYDHIYGEPTFNNMEPQTALVMGSNGISGYNMVTQLARNPQRWSKVYSASRSPQEDDNLPQNVQQISIDLSLEPKNIAETLKKNNVKAVDHIFFFAYLQPKANPDLGLWDNQQQMTQVNLNLLVNFLKALELAELIPKRFLLQTGAKHYGIHLGACRNPSLEDLDGRVQGPPNFYYYQEDALFEWCKKNKVEWNVVRPARIMGVARRAFMNFILPLTIYASVQKKLGQKLIWPGNAETYDKMFSVSTAILNSMLEEWAVLTPKAANQSFNAEDGTPFTFSVFWPMLAKLYGIDYTTPADDEKPNNVEYKELEMPHPVKGYGNPGLVQYKFTFSEWAQKPEVQEAYKELAKEQGLPEWYINDEENLKFGDSCLLTREPHILAMTKARKLGFFGCTDPYEAFLDTVKDMIKMHICPKPF